MNDPKNRTPLQKTEDIIGYIAFKMCLLLSKIVPMGLTTFILATLAVLLCPFIPQTYLVLKNLKMAMPELSFFERIRIMFGVWFNLGKFSGEFLYIYRLKKGEIFKYVKVDDYSNGIFEEIKEYNRRTKSGCIIFSAHIANWEAGVRFLADSGMKVSVVFRKQNNPLIEPKYSADLRQKVGINMIAKQYNAAINIVRNLKKGNNVIILVDQRDNMNGIAAKFFGRKAYTSDTVYTLANRLQLPVYAMRLIRENGRTKFRTMVEKKHYDVENTTKTEFVQEINDTVEKWVRATPEQWFWVHDRWK